MISRRWITGFILLEGPLFPVPDAFGLDGRVPGPRQAHHGNEGPEIRNHGAGLDGDAARGSDGV